MSGPEIDFTATKRSADALVSWRQRVGPTTWTLTRSSNGGQTFVTVATVPNATSEDEWNTDTQLFEVEDGDAAAGDLYVLTSTDGVTSQTEGVALLPNAHVYVTLWGQIVNPRVGQPLRFQDRVVILQVPAQKYNGSPVVPGVFEVTAADDGFWHIQVTPGLLMRVRIGDTVRTVRAPQSGSHALAALTDEGGYGRMS